MQATDVFKGLSAAGRAAVARGLVRHDFQKGETLIEKGQQVSGAYFVVRGELRVFTLSPGGKEATLYLIRPGETCVLALNSLFNKLLYPAWVQAEEATAVAVVPGPLYRQLFASERVIQDLTVHALSTVVFRLMTELEQVHAWRLDQRLASLLLNKASDDGVVQKTQQEIAAHIGTTREVVARLLADFSAHAWIATGRGRITVLQPASLAAVIGRDGAL
jgi:CRP/FNR family transcriptional regulator